MVRFLPYYTLAQLKLQVISSSTSRDVDWWTREGRTTAVHLRIVEIARVPPTSSGFLVSRRERSMRAMCGQVLSCGGRGEAALWICGRAVGVWQRGW